MVGDYVTFRECQQDSTPTIIKIWQINGDNEAFVSIDNDDALDEIAIDNEIVGIQLTPEILVKNGFHFGYTANEEEMCEMVACEYPEKGWCYGEGAGEIKVIFPNETDGGLIRIDDECYDRAIAFVFAKQVFVHQLQHAIRLAGIEKEIVL